MNEFNESEHPRDNEGKFATKGSGGEHRQNTSYTEILAQSREENASKEFDNAGLTNSENNSRITLPKDKTTQTKTSKSKSKYIELKGAERLKVDSLVIQKNAMEYLPLNYVNDYENMYFYDNFTEDYQVISKIKIDGNEKLLKYLQGEVKNGDIANAKRFIRTFEMLRTINR